MWPNLSRTGKSVSTDREAKLQELALLESQKKLKEGLPYLHGWKHYKWSRKFFESRNHENFLVAANQIGKSSIQIRKCIHWATSPDLWPELWNTALLGKPNQFWYLYPTRDVATIEWKTKWSLFMPANEYKNHPVYGWTAEVERKQIQAIHFHTGVSVYFKTYAQSVMDLQTGTCFSVFCDEELPVPLLPELQARLNASDGYFHLVFTATLGQDHWRKTMEEQGGQLEKHKGAFKLSVSLMDCKEFEDGTPSHWSDEKIQRAIAKCPTKAEVQRRIYGRFVMGDGLKYAAFDHEKNTTDEIGIPKDWVIYAGVDVGSGGKTGHPAAIVFVGVSPDYKQGRVFKAWRGDGIDTTPSDVLNKFREMRGDLQIITQYYDWASKDFFNVASRLGESFSKAEKSHEIGEGILNTLFRHSMLKVQRGDDELDKLIAEVTSLLNTTAKNKSIDDLIDALRYTVTGIPWNYQAVEENIDLENLFSKALNPIKPKKLTHEQIIDKERDDSRKAWLAGTESNQQKDELDEWQELYDG
jgi:hypothetical protein